MRLTQAEVQRIQRHFDRAAAIDRVRAFCDGWELDHGVGAHPVVLQGLNHAALAFADLRELLGACAL